MMERGSRVFLLFHVCKERHALEASLVVEVIPLIAITPLPGALTGVAGVINYRGVPVPVLDLAALAWGRRAAGRISTPILVLVYAPKPESRHLLGFVAE
jgi:chemotaxis-related protein WspB